MSTVTCPDLQMLQHLAAGHLDEEAARPLEEHLCQCSACVDRLQEQPADDPLQQDVRRWAQEGSQVSDSPQVQELMQFLQQLPAGSNWQPSSGLLCQALGRAVQTRAIPSLQAAQPAEDEDDQSRNPSPGNWPRTGRYRLQRLLGSGGMGAVYLAEDPELERTVAVKVPRFALSSPADSTTRQRFLTEARLAAKITHPNVCPIYDVGEEKDVPFVVMAYIEGSTLADRLQQQGPFSDPREAVALALQLAEGLHAIHDLQVIHRDLKPGNVLLDRNGKALLTDFGLARWQYGEHITAEGTLLGTPAYMAPEQLTSSLGPVSERSDIYGLGVMLYQMLTGRLPFEGDEPRQLLYQIVHETPPAPRALRPDLHPALEAVILKATARQPEDRYPSAEELAAALRCWLEQAGNQEAYAFQAAPIAHSRALALAPHPGAASPVALLPAPVETSAGVQKPVRRWGRRLVFLVVLPLLATATVAGVYYTAYREPFTAEVNMRIWRLKEMHYIGPLFLDDLGALPLRQGDELKVVCNLNRAGYVYAFWIDTNGKVTPVYPWETGKWDKRPKVEKPVRDLEIPRKSDIPWHHLDSPQENDIRWAPMTSNQSGMATLLLLMRTTRLPNDVQMDARLANLESLPPLKDRLLLRFRNGKLLKATPEPGADNPPEIPPLDPVVQRQQQLWDLVKDYCDVSEATVFRYEGKCN